MANGNGAAKNGRNGHAPRNGASLPAEEAGVVGDMSVIGAEDGAGA
jgi:hypothetical protein